MKTKTRGRSKATLYLSLFFYLIRALPLKEEGLRHSVESVVRGMGLLFSALPFEFALRKVTIISDKATEGNDFTLVRQGIGVAVTGLSLAGIDRKKGATRRGIRSFGLSYNRLLASSRIHSLLR